ncbi:MAG: hypothetical protein AAFQ68_23345, partial [Bacteroidota bacterium]
MQRFVWTFIVLICGAGSACKPKNSTANPPAQNNTPTVVEENTFHLPPDDSASLTDLVQPSTRYLLRDSSLAEFFMVNEKGIFFFDKAGVLEPEKAELAIYANEYGTTLKMFSQFPLDSMIRYCREKGRSAWPERFKSLSLPKRFRYNPGAIAPLKGLRVALDPGHMAANAEVAEIEGK